jgi:hypothetical protein
MFTSDVHYLPVMNNLFASAPIDIIDWIKITVCGLIAYGIAELVPYS